MHVFTLVPSAAVAVGSARTADLGGSSGPDLTRYLIACAGLILLLGGLAWVARRYLSSTLKARAGRRALQVLDMLPLGGKQRLCVVRCYDRTFALGLGEKEVSLVAEIDPAHAAAKKPAEPSQADKHAFLQALSKARERWNGREVRA